MRRTGYRFYISGEYCTDTTPVDDPNDRDWKQFENGDIHPDGDSHFVVWSQFESIDDEELQRMINVAVTVIDWLRLKDRWYYFDATLWLARSDRDTEVYRWELV